MQIQTTMRHHFTPIRMVIIQKKKNQKKTPSDNNKYCQGCGEICGILLVGMQNGKTAIENSMELSQKIKNKTTI